MPRLQDKLDEITQNTRRLVPDDRLAIPEQSIAEILAEGIEDRILPVGATAPEFILQDASSGKMVRSADLLALGPVVLNFFRGRWCPYCTTELETWRDLNATVRERGGILAGASPQTQRQSDFTVQQHHIPFPLLWDKGASVAEAFGITYIPSEQMRQYYLAIMVNLPFIHTGKNALASKRVFEPDDWKLPLPATFVIGQDGRIKFSEVHADFRVRPEPEDILAILDSLR